MTASRHLSMEPVVRRLRRIAAAAEFHFARTTKNAGLGPR